MLVLMVAYAKDRRLPCLDQVMEELCSFEGDLKDIEKKLQEKFECDKARRAEADEVPITKPTITHQGGHEVLHVAAGFANL